MSQLWKRRLGLLVGVMLLVSSLAVSSQAALLSYHWHDENPDWARGSDWPTGSDWVSASDTGTNTWNGISDFKWSYDGIFSIQDAELRYFTYSGDQATWLGKTQPTLTSGSTTHLYWTESSLNKAYAADWSTASTTASNKYDVRSVVAHEMGHAAGLGHNTGTACIMYATFAKGEQRRTPCTAEKNELISRYNNPH